MSSKPFRWLGDAITVPPFSKNAALAVGALLEIVALGEKPAMPHSRPMRSVGPRCYELRVNDGNKAWRVVYHIAEDAIVILDVFAKKSQATPKHVIDRRKRRLRRYERER
jgi:phage-related protein